MKQLLTIVFIGLLCWGCMDEDNYDDGGEVIDQEGHKDGYKEGFDEGILEGYDSGYSDASPKENEEGVHVNTVNIKSKEAKEELEEFWKAFQDAVAENNIDLIISMSSMQGLKETNEDLRNNFDEYFDEEARKQIAAATVDALLYEEDSPTGVKAYSFWVSYIVENEGGGDEVGESFHVFYFAMVEGQFKLISDMWPG